jgi:hypothetical protein
VNIVKESDRMLWPNAPVDCEFTRALHQFHQIGGDEVIDREFSAVCRAIWGYGPDDFTDDDLSPNDHAWLDGLTQERALSTGVLPKRSSETVRNHRNAVRNAPE